MISDVGDMPSDEVEDSDELFALDPAQFVAMRNALVRTLKARGDADGAAEVATMRKPPRTAWALNLLARTDPDRVRAVVDSGADVARALHEGGDVLRRAQRSYTEAVDDAVRAAAEHSGVDGEQMRGRMRATLLAAGAEPDGEVARRLSAGTLLDDHDAPGFSFSAVAGPSEVAPRPSTRSRGTGAKIGGGRGRRPARASGPDETIADPADGAADATTDGAAEAAAQEAAAQARRDGIRRRRHAERELDRLRKRAERLESQAEEAAAKAAALRSEADAATAEVETLESTLVALIEQLEQDGSPT